MSLRKSRDPKPTETYVAEIDSSEVKLMLNFSISIHNFDTVDLQQTHNYDVNLPKVALLRQSELRKQFNRVDRSGRSF